MIFRSLFFKKLKLKINNRYPKDRVLVLAPHQDYETFGCGGAIKWHTLQKDEVKIIFLTALENKRISQQRRDETQKATKILGVDNLLFWQFRDGQLSVDNKAINDLTKILIDYQPKIIYVPSFLDLHFYHLNTTKILVCTIKKIKNHNFWIFSYEVWTPIYANRLILIN